MSDTDPCKTITLTVRGRERKIIRILSNFIEVPGLMATTAATTWIQDLRIYKGLTICLVDRYGIHSPEKMEIFAKRLGDLIYKEGGGYLYTITQSPPMIIREAGGS